jgi:hypothetical protein
MGNARHIRRRHTIFSQERAAILTLASAKVLESLLDLLFIAIGQLLTAKKRMRLHLLTIENEYAKVLLFEEELIHIFDPLSPGARPYTTGIKLDNSTKATKSPSSALDITATPRSVIWNSQVSSKEAKFRASSTWTPSHQKRVRQPGCLPSFSRRPIIRGYLHHRLQSRNRSQRLQESFDGLFGLSPDHFCG